MVTMALSNGSKWHRLQSFTQLSITRNNLSEFFYLRAVK